MKKIVSRLLFLTALCLMACEKDDHTDKKGIEGSVQGRVFDARNGIPAMDFKVRIAEFNRVTGGPAGSHERFVRFLDSAVTDADGRYHINFTTSGKGDTYRVMLEHYEAIFDYYSGSNDLPDPDADTLLDFDVLHLYPIDVKITLDAGVALLPVRVGSDHTSFGEEGWMLQTDVEYTRRILADKNSPNEVRLYRTKPDGVQYQIATYTIPATHTTELTEYAISALEEDFVDE